MSDDLQYALSACCDAPIQRWERIGPRYLGSPKLSEELRCSRCFEVCAIGRWSELSEKQIQEAKEVPDDGR